ncbi:MAG: transposase-like protein, partial [candidate division NC10 bacterium]|nr:transposase-like protein [candidate division NC10 bacterium]
MMRRAFGLNVLRCPRCAGRMPVIATIDDPAVIEWILAHLGLPGARAGSQPLSAGAPARAEQPVLPDMTLEPLGLACFLTKLRDSLTRYGGEFPPHLGRLGPTSGPRGSGSFALGGA